MNFLQKMLVQCKYIGHYARDERSNQEVPDELSERRERCGVGVLRSVSGADERGRTAAQTLSSGGLQRRTLSGEDGLPVEVSSLGFSAA